jgi:signal transduction histidine kinase/DNA-binding NarL/FixJ family response regulator
LRPASQVQNHITTIDQGEMRSIKRIATSQLYGILFLMITGISINFFVEFRFKTLIQKYVDGQNNLRSDIQLIEQLNHFRTKLTLMRNEIQKGFVPGNHIHADSRALTDLGEKLNREIKLLPHDFENVKIHADSMVALVKRLRLIILNTLELSTKKKEGINERLRVLSEVDLLGNSITLLLEDIDIALESKIANEFTHSSDRAIQLNNIQSWKLWANVIYLVMAAMVVRNLINTSKLILELNVSREREAESNKAKDHFIANISHELRTPLNSIGGYADLLQKTNLGALQLQFVKAIQYSGSNLTQIVNQLLDFSKLQAGALPTQKMEFNVREFLGQFESTLTERFNRKGILFIMTIAPDVPDSVEGDLLKLNQVLTNIVGNAWKFTEVGSVKMTVEGTHTPDGHWLLGFTVTDTGIGIAESTLPHIFERFYQADSQHSRKHEGTGLGLAISRHLIELMGGDILVSSELGKGTMFRISLPFNPAFAASNAAFTQRIVNIRHALKVLVIDDNELNLNLVCHLLESWGFAVEAVKSAQAALDKLTRETFDLVLVDIQMPEMDGYTLTRKIRNELQLSVPIIALTAYARANESERNFKSGLNDFISKPFKEAELYKAISKVIERVKPGRINLSYLKSISKGNLKFEKRILDQFVGTAPQQLILLEEHIKNSNVEGIYKTIHDLKVNISVLGLESTLRESMESILAFCKEGKTADALKSFKVFSEHCHAAIEEIKGMSEHFVDINMNSKSN